MIHEREIEERERERERETERERDCNFCVFSAFIEKIDNFRENSRVSMDIPYNYATCAPTPAHFANYNDCHTSDQWLGFSTKRMSFLIKQYYLPTSPLLILNPAYGRNFVTYRLPFL